MAPTILPTLFNFLRYDLARCAGHNTIPKNAKCTICSQPCRYDPATNDLHPSIVRLPGCGAHAHHGCILWWAQTAHAIAGDCPYCDRRIFKYKSLTWDQLRLLYTDGNCDVPEYEEIREEYEEVFGRFTELMGVRRRVEEAELEEEVRGRLLGDCEEIGRYLLGRAEKLRGKVGGESY